jgi:MYXO-CTERM domain-containing protein
LLSSVDALAAKYLTTQQQQVIRSGVSTGASSSLLPLLLAGALAFVIIRRR